MDRDRFWGVVVAWFWRALSSVSAITLFAMMMLVVLDVAGRYLFNAPISGSFEVTEFLLALLVFAALPIVTRDDNHISVSVVENLLSGRTQLAQRLFVLGFGAVGLALIAWRLWVGGNELAAGRQVTGYLELPRAPIAYTASVLTSVACVTVLAMMRQCVRRGAADKGNENPPTASG